MLRFDLSACSHLRVFELRLDFSSYAFRDLMLWLASIVSTVTSPVFSRFVFVANRAVPHLICRKAGWKNGWEPADQALLRLSQRTGMKVIVKGSALREPFCDVMRAAFPLMVTAEAFEFEPNG